ncbi:MAG: hypothetical protein ACRDOJ_03485 [Nocardioidaceae bacterium]
MAPSAVFADNGRRFDRRELYFGCRLTRAVDVDMSGDVYGAEHSDHRWWSLCDMQGSGVEFVPRDLTRLLPSVLAGASSVEPLDVGE